jgi:hypothetical protein
MKRAFLPASLVVLGVALACAEPAIAPLGFDRVPEQRFRLEMRDETVVDSVVVDIERLADVRFVVAPEDSSTFELEMFLERYYLSVEGGQGGEGGRTQVAISPEAFASRAADGTELRLQGHEKTPSARTVSELLALPVGGTALDRRGASVRAAWHSSDPLLEEVDLLGWLLLGLPVEADGEAAWEASREVPRIGRYRMGIEMPLRFELRAGGSEIGIAGFVQRPEITLQEGYAGAIELELEGQARPGDAGRIARASYVLRMKFEAVDGSVIRSTHRVTLECLGCT